MKIFEFVQRFKMLIKCINAENTGDANQFADKMGISRSQLFNYLRLLKRYGVKIKYDNKQNSYVISNHKKIQYQSPIRILRKNEPK